MELRDMHNGVPNFPKCLSVTSSILYEEKSGKTLGTQSTMALNYLSWARCVCVGVPIKHFFLTNLILLKPNVQCEKNSSIYINSLYRFCWPELPLRVVRKPQSPEGKSLLEDFGKSGRSLPEDLKLPARSYG